MRKINLNHITISGETFPIHCDLYVLEQIQEKMSLSEFERGILGAVIIRDSDGNPQYDEDNRIKLRFDKYNLNTIAFGLALMINEGITIENEQENKKTELISENYLKRISTTANVLSDITQKAFNSCFESKKNETEGTMKDSTSPKRKTSK